MSSDGNLLYSLSCDDDFLLIKEKQTGTIVLSINRSSRDLVLYCVPGTLNQHMSGISADAIRGCRLHSKGIKVSIPVQVDGQTDPIPLDFNIEPNHANEAWCEMAHRLYLQPVPA